MITEIEVYVYTCVETWEGSPMNNQQVFTDERGAIQALIVDVRNTVEDIYGAKRVYGDMSDDEIANAALSASGLNVSDRFVYYVRRYRLRAA